MSAEKTRANIDFSEALKPLTDALNAAAEQINLAMQCKMRRFYLVRHEDSDPDKISGTGVIAEGVVFEDGTVAMRWKTRWKSTAIYDNVEDLQAIHGHGGKMEMKFIDAERA